MKAGWRFSPYQLQIPLCFPTALKYRCPPQRQRHFRDITDKAYDTLHLASQSRVQKEAFAPPHLWIPPKETAVRSPLTGRVPPFLVISSPYCHRQGKRKLWFYIVNCGNPRFPLFLIYKLKIFLHPQDAKFNW